MLFYLKICWTDLEREEGLEWVRIGILALALPPLSGVILDWAISFSPLKQKVELNGH